MMNTGQLGRRVAGFAIALHLITLIGVSLHAAQAPASQTRPATGASQMPPAIPLSRTGEEIFRATCVTCHGLDGKGSPRSILGFETPPPDFTDCGFATAEADADWQTVVHEGGPIRGLDRHMPAFGDALTKDEIARAVGYIRTFCAEKGWPRGNLNFPRAFFTEKAFPESETVFITSFSTRGPREIEQAVEYERRMGPRGQIAVEVPLVLEQDGSRWIRGMADIEVAYKHVLFSSVGSGTILSASGIVTLPTGDQIKGLGGGVVEYEPVVLLGQRLPGNLFMQAQAGLKFPAVTGAENSAYVNISGGRSFSADRGFGRLWTPQFEVLWARPFGGESEVDVVPSLQISLSKIQHVRAAVGARVPVTQRSERGSQVLFYLLWDWADGGFFEFWK